MDEPGEVDFEIEYAQLEDAPEILEVQRLAFTEEMKEYGFFDIPPITETEEEFAEEFGDMVVLKAISDEKIVGAVRARKEHGSCMVGKLVVHPDLWNKGIGRSLMVRIESACSEQCRMELFTGSRSLKNISLYESLGYQTFKTMEARGGIRLVYMEKIRDCATRD